MKYSVVIPLYNEDESIDELHRRLTSVMKTVAPNDYEIIFVNDGSTDNSLKEIKKLQKKDPSIHIVSFRINQGKAAALSIGFEASKGEYVITMDADLQDEPKEIPKLIAKLNQGYDMVSGWKENRQDPIDKTLPSKVFNRAVSFLSGVTFHDFNCGFKIYKREVTKEIKIYGQLYRFLPVLVHERGFKIAEVRVKHNKRKYGKSKYSWKRFFPGMADLLTVTFLVKFGKRPLHFFGACGGFLFLLGLGILLYLLVRHYIGFSVNRSPLLIAGAVILITGLQIILTGLIAEMITRNNHSNSEYPIVVEE